MKKEVSDLLHEISIKTNTIPNYYHTLFEKLNKCLDDEGCEDLRLDKNEIAALKKSSKRKK